MKKLLTILAVSALLFISCGKAKVDENGCYYDIDDAVAVANKKNQDIMLIISVDGDDADSTDFMDKVVRDPGFKNEIAVNYAVVNMDFSQTAFEATAAAEDADAKTKKAADAKAEIMKKHTRLVTLLEVAETPVVYILSKEKYFLFNHQCL